MGTTRTILANPVTTNGNGRSVTNPYVEIGTTGIEAWSGYIFKAYTSELYWPQCYPIYNRIYRSDPEIGGIVRPGFVGFSRQTSIDWELPENPSDDDKRAQDYGRELIDDMEGGGAKTLEEIVTVALMGFGWWEVVMGKRDPNWKPPQGDTWRSQYDDGLPAIRRLAWRDHASFNGWDMDDGTGRVKGFKQYDSPNPPVTIPKERSMHLTFGDPNNPEGLSPLEAVYRLEQIKYRLEVIEGAGFEKTAGYLRFVVAQALTTEDKAMIRDAAAAVMTTQAKNYLAMPAHVTADVMDIDFVAAPALRTAINNYAMAKLQIFAMQWVAMSTTSGTGSFSAHSDSTAMALMHYNGMMEGMASQMDAQLGRRIFSHPQVLARFPGMTKRPKLIIKPIEKGIDLTQLADFIQAITTIMPLSDDDIISIRRRSGFLSEALPPKEDSVTDEPIDVDDVEPIEDDITAVGDNQ